MSKLNELQEQLLNIESQIASLSEEKSRISEELKELKLQHVRETLDRISGELKTLNIDQNEIAKALGFSVGQPTQKKTRGLGKPKSTSVAKYRSTLDPTLTWSGKGRRPSWIQVFQENGGNLEEWLIKN